MSNRPLVSFASFSIRTVILLLVVLPPQVQCHAAPQIPESTSNYTRKQLKAFKTESFNLIRVGKDWDAEQKITERCKKAAEEFGEDSHEHAQLLYIQAVTYAGMRNLESATASLRRASDIPGKTQQGKKDRLTYLMNLGEFLILTDKRDKAEKILRKGLEQREDFYGIDHSGYAFGQEALAKVLISQGKYGEAFLLCEKAFKIEIENGNPHVAEDVTTMAFAMAGNSPENDSWTLFENLSPPLRSRAVTYAQTVALEMQPELSLRVFESLKANLDQFESANPNDKVNVLVAISNAAWGAGKPAKRIAAFKETLKLLPKNSPSIPEIHLALAVAYEDNDQVELIEPSYAAAVEHADSNKNNRMLAKSLREFAIWLANSTKDLEKTEAIHKRSIQVASGLDDLTHGHALCAYGVFLQHNSRFAPAAKMLEKSLDLLPEGHPYLFTAKNHLPFAQRGEECKCKESATDITLEMINGMMAKRLPEDLFDEVFIGENQQLEVRTKRKPSEAEAALIKRALDNVKNKMKADR